MAIDAITLNDDIFDPINISNTRVVRKVLAGTNQTQLYDPFLLDISHQDGSKGKPDRHMVKLSANVNCADDVIRPISLHLVATIPKDVLPSVKNLIFSSATASLTDTMVDLISSGTDYGFMTSFTNGGFDTP